MTVMIQVENLNKRFTLHNQGGVSYPVLNHVSFVVNAGECVVLDGRSGSGKSTLLRSLYANYKPQSGHIRVRHGDSLTDLTNASAREVLAIRRQTLGYVSQFLRVIPRVPALEVVMEPLRNLGVDRDTCRERATSLLQQLNVPETLWHLPPSTFSGGEQQRVNIARGFVVDYPILLLDEPTASLDARNRDVVISLIHQARQRGAAIVGIFHDADVRDHLADRTIPVGNSNQEHAA